MDRLLYLIYEHIKEFAHPTNCSKGFVARLPGEHPRHYPCYNYLGPGTDYMGRQLAHVQPVNIVDYAAMHHDADYNRIHKLRLSGTVDLREIENRVRNADERFVKYVSELPRNVIPSDGSQIWAVTLIVAKMKLENRGVMSRLQFV